MASLYLGNACTIGEVDNKGSLHLRGACTSGESVSKVLHLGDQAFCEFDVFSEMLVTHLDNRNPDLCQTRLFILVLVPDGHV